MFQKRIHLSAVPPPEASKPFWWGLQPIAFTAAWCSENLAKGCSPLWRLHINSLLSLPPDANYCSSNDHFNPHTPCLCPTSFYTCYTLALRSLYNIFLSRDPVLIMDPFQATDPTLLKCPVNVLTILQWLVSHI